MRIRSLKHIILLVGTVLYILFPGHARSQTVVATAKVDTSTIKIGGQFILSLDITHPPDVKIEWPAPADTFSLFELVSRSQSDTVISKADNSIRNSQHFKITSFDSGFHVIPPFVFNYSKAGDTTRFQATTDPILITVQSVPVDTTRAIKDIKGQIAFAFSWQDLLPYFFAIIIIVLIVLLVVYLVKKFKPEKKIPVIYTPKRPAHEIALEALKELDETKLWQQGNYKGYHTILSDIIRTYIQNRWSVAAMEMTTDEILHLQIISSQNQEVYSALKNMLELSDLVKFAKVIPIHHENEQSMRSAVAFVKANLPVTEMKEVTA